MYEIFIENYKTFFVVTLIIFCIFGFKFFINAVRS